MINKKYAQMYCAQPIELIENYEKAVNDTTQMWHCHHVWETMLGYTAEELIEMNEYYGIPACNLIFLTHSEHMRLHMTGEGNPQFGKKGELSTCYGRTGEKHPMFGKKHTEESRKKMSEKLKGGNRTSFKKGMKRSEESIRKQSETQRNNKFSKQVLQFTKDVVFVAEYPSICEVERQCGYSHSFICQVLKGNRKSAYGFIWRYKI